MVKHKLNKEGQPQARVAKTRQKVLDVAGRLFVEQGFEHVSVEEILQHTDIARSTFYRLFENKEAVLAQLCCPAFVEGEKQFIQLLHLQGRELMRELLTVYANLWESYSTGMVLSLGLGKPYQYLIGDVHDGFVSALMPLVKRLENDGALRNGDAHLSSIIIARTCVTVLQIYQGQKRRKDLFISSMEGMLLNY